jgi:hypothetical protein
MGPLESLHRAEQQIQEAARRGAKIAKAEPRKATAGIRSSVRGTPKPKGFRTGIVSINGHDVEKMRCTGGPRVN